MTENIKFQCSSSIEVKHEATTHSEAYARLLRVTSYLIEIRTNQDLVNDFFGFGWMTYPNGHCAAIKKGLDSVLTARKV